MAGRSPVEIRSSIENNRMELALSIGRLRGEVERLTDWRGHLQRHRNEVNIGVAVLGAVIGVRLLSRRRRRRR